MLIGKAGIVLPALLQPTEEGDSAAVGDGGRIPFHLPTFFKKCESPEPPGSWTLGVHAIFDSHQKIFNQRPPQLG